MLMNNKKSDYLRKIILVAACFAITTANMAQSREQLDNPDLLLKFKEDSISLVSYIRENTKLTEMDAVVEISRLDEWRCWISLGIKDNLSDNAAEFAIDIIVLARRWYAKNGYKLNNNEPRITVHSVETIPPPRERERIEIQIIFVTAFYRKDYNDIWIRGIRNRRMVAESVKFPDD